MKIALVGTHGVGKTTLGISIYHFFQRKMSVKFSTGIPREIINRGFKLGKDATLASYIEYIVAQLSALSEADKFDLFISDRSILDTYAYALVNKKRGNSLISDTELRLLQLVWELERERYDLFIYLPIQFCMEKDGVRPEGELYRAEVSNQMLQLLKNNNLPVEIVTGNKEAMYKAAVSIIEQFLDSFLEM